MRNKVLTFGVAVTCLLLTVAAVHAANTERVLYSADGVNVATPYGLSADTSGNLYGAAGGTYERTLTDRSSDLLRAPRPLEHVGAL